MVEYEECHWKLKIKDESISVLQKNHEALQCVYVKVYKIIRTFGGVPSTNTDLDQSW